MGTVMNPSSQPQLGRQLSGYIARLHSMTDGADEEQLERHIDNLYVEYTGMREEVTALYQQLYDNKSSNRGSQTSISSPGHPTTCSPSLDETGALSTSTQNDDSGRWRACIERLLAEYRRWLVDIYKQYDEQFTPEKLDNMFIDHDARQEATRLLARLSGGIGWMEGHSDPLLDKWETRLEHYGQLVRDLAEFKKATAGRTRWGARPRRVILETISLHGDAILEFNTAMSDDPVLRFRVSSHILAECSPAFAHMFSMHSNDISLQSKHPGLLVENDIPPSPIQFSDADGSRIQLWRMPQPELNKESALSILLHAAHMHHEHVPRSISFERLVALAEAAIRYRCTKPLELFFEHCWLHQWIHKASDEMPDGLVTISYAFGRRRLFSRVTKSVILHLVDEEELRAKSWPSAVKDKIWAVRGAKMSQVYAACSETIEDYLRRPKVSPEIPVPRALCPVVEQPLARADTWSWKPGQRTAPLSSAAEVTTTPTRRDTWSWKPGSSSTRLPPVGSPSRPISRPIIYEPPSPPTHTRDTSHTSPPTRTPLPPSPFTFTTTPRCPQNSHWCDATNLGWLLLIYNELRLFSAILGPSALNGLSLSPNQTNSPARRSLAQVLDALRGMANPPSPVHPGGVCDPVPAFREAIHDVWGSVVGLALEDVERRGRGGLGVMRLHGEGVVGLREVDKYLGGFGPRIPNGSMAPSRALREERICLGILRALDTFDAIRAVATLNHRTYNIYKTNEQGILRNLVAVGRGRTMVQLAGYEVKAEDELCNKGGKSRLFSQILLDTHLVNNSDNSEAASTRAIKRASSEASSDSDSDSDSDWNWNFEGEPRSLCESLDITEGLGIVTTATATGDDTTPDGGGGSVSESPVVIKSSSWQEITTSPEYVVHRGRGSSFYSFTEQEAYGILWPAEEGTSVPRDGGRDSFGVVVQDSYREGGEVKNRGDENLKYSRDEGWFALHVQHQHQGGGTGSKVAMEDKSLALMVEGNGNNKLLREEFDRRVGFAL